MARSVEQQIVDTKKRLAAAKKAAATAAIAAKNAKASKEVIAEADNLRKYVASLEQSLKEYVGNAQTFITKSARGDKLSVLEKDEFDILIGGFLNKNLVACCITSKINTDLYKLRQMAVSYEYQGNGFGIKLLNFAEQYAISKKAKYIELNARKTAVEFYKKNDYYIVGELFFEVGIEHYKMQKQID
jgi:predicted GNAT family N-acyltransferase